MLFLKDSAAEDNRPGPSSQTPATAVTTGEAVAGTSGTGGDGYTMSSDESDDEDDMPESSTDSSDPDYQ